MNEELRFHFEQQVQKYVSSGLAADEARRQARLTIGGEDKVREDCREARGVGFIETLFSDLRYGARSLRKDPIFALVALLTLALSMGATTAIFSVVDAVLLRPLPYADPDRLMVVWENNTRLHHPHNVVAPPNFVEWKAQNSVFESMSAMADTRANLTGHGDPRQVIVANVTPGFFSVVGVNPMLGAGFTEDNWTEGKDDVVLLEYGFWKEQFGGDPGIVGQSIELNGKPVVVVGVAPKNFNLFIKDGSLTNSKPQMWSPWTLPKDWGDRSKGFGRYLTVVARLKQGVSLAQAKDQMETIAGRMQQTYPDSNAHWGATVLSIREQLSGDLRPALLTLFGAVGFVLLIACANVSSLLLARAARREKEIAIRTVIGASRWRVAQQLLTESLLLAILGGVGGLALAVWGTNALLTAGPRDLLDLHAATINLRVLSFAAGATLLATTLFGFLPSYLAANSQVSEALKDEGRGSSGGKRRQVLRNLLVIGQMGLALVLLAGAGLLIRSFVRLVAVDPGFEVKNLLTFQVGLPRGNYPKDPQQLAFFQQFLSRIRNVPGVHSVTLENYPPLAGLGAATGVRIIGHPVVNRSDFPVSGVRVVGPDYFATLGIPILAGRSFSNVEMNEVRHVVVVNQAFVDKYLKDESPLGKKLSIYMHDDKVDDANPSEIIGVCGSVHQMGLDDEAKPNVYWPMPELMYSRMTILVRTANDPVTVLPSIRSTLRHMDSELPIASVATMEQLLADSLARARFTMFLLGVFAAIALLLTAVGIYGVMSYSVAQRTHEIGIRMALGAQRGNVLGLVLGHGARLMIAGVAIGVIASLALTHLMSSLLYGTSATDPAIFAVVTITLIAVSFFASYMPARHATRVSPVVALRYE